MVCTETLRRFTSNVACQETFLILQFFYSILLVFIARFYAERGIATTSRQSLHLSDRPSVTLKCSGRKGWNTSKIISRLISLWFSLSNGNTKKFSRNKNGKWKIGGLEHKICNISETGQERGRKLLLMLKVIHEELIAWLHDLERPLSDNRDVLCHIFMLRPNRSLYLLCWIVPWWCATYFKSVTKTNYCLYTRYQLPFTVASLGFPYDSTAFLSLYEVIPTRKPRYALLSLSLSLSFFLSGCQSVCLLTLLHPDL